MDKLMGVISRPIASCRYIRDMTRPIAPRSMAQGSAAQVNPAICVQLSRRQASAAPKNNYILATILSTSVNDFLSQHQDSMYRTKEAKPKMNHDEDGLTSAITGYEQLTRG